MVYDEANKNITENNSTLSDICIEFKSRAEEDAFLTDFMDERSSVSSPTQFVS